MTCIVGIEADGKVYLAGDKQGTDSNGYITHTTPKVFTLGNEHIIAGFTSSYRFGQLLEHFMLFQPSDMPQPGAVYPWLVTTFIPKLMDVLEDGKWSGPQDKDEETEEAKCGECLIGVYDQLWVIQEDYSVLRNITGVEAIGSGAEYAIGYLTASLKHSADLEYDSILTETIEAVAKVCPSVGSHSNIIQTKGSK